MQVCSKGYGSRWKGGSGPGPTAMSAEAELASCVNEDVVSRGMADLTGLGTWLWRSTPGVRRAARGCRAPCVRAPRPRAPPPSTRRPLSSLCTGAAGWLVTRLQSRTGMSRLHAMYADACSLRSPQAYQQEPAQCHMAPLKTGRRKASIRSVHELCMTNTAALFPPFLRVSWTCRVNGHL